MSITSGGWSFDGPTEEGTYLVNYGDVVTPYSMRLITVIGGSHGFVFMEAKKVAELTATKFKWLKIDTNKLNEM